MNDSPNEQSSNLYAISNILRPLNKYKNDIRGTCSTHGKTKIFIQYSRETSLEDVSGNPDKEGKLPL